MKISYRRFNNTRHSKPLFVTVSKFDTDGFPVPVRHLRVRQTSVSKTAQNNPTPNRVGVREAAVHRTQPVASTAS